MGFRVWGLGFRGLGFRVWGLGFTGLLSNQGAKSINFYFIMVPFNKVLKYGTPKPSLGETIDPRIPIPLELFWSSAFGLTSPEEPAACDNRHQSEV